jgi:hypothetical protein
MSFFPGKDPQAGDKYACEAIAQVIVPRTVDLGDFAVRRALPSARTRMVGPFIFFDHFGPAEFRAGTGIDVRPHICSTARSCTATASAPRRRSSRARSIG